MRKPTLVSIISLTAAIGAEIAISSDAKADGYVTDKSFAPLPVYNWSEVLLWFARRLGRGPIGHQRISIADYSVPIPSELSGSNNTIGGLGGVQLGLNSSGVSGFSAANSGSVERASTALPTIVRVPQRPSRRPSAPASQLSTVRLM